MSKAQMGVKPGRQDARKGAGEGAASGIHRYALPAAVVALLLFAYSNSFDAPFLMDNAEMIRDTRIQEVTSGHIYRILTQRYWEGMTDQLYRPLTTLSYMLNYAVLGNGTAPAGYHWFNFVLHAANVLLVYWLGLAIFREVRAAALLAGLWGLNPVLTESVTNVVGRADIMAAGGVLAALLAHRKALHSAGLRKAAWLAAVALAVTAGIFSKESGIVAIAAVVLWDLAFERSVRWRARLPGYAAAAVPCAVFLFVRAQVLANLPWTPIAFVDNPLVGADFWTARITAVKVIGKYVIQLTWASLSIDYSYDQIPLFSWTLTAWEDWLAVLSVAGCAAALIAGVRSWKRKEPLFFFIVFFFVTLAPVSNLVILIGTIMGERLVYLPSVGFAGCLVCGVLAWPASEPAWRKAMAAALIFVAIAFTVRTWDRNSDWLDERRFWERARKSAPRSYKTILNAALHRPLVGLTDVALAIRDVEGVLAILDRLPDDRNSATAYADAGTFFRNIGDGIASRKEGAALVGGSAEYWYRKSLKALLRCERIELAQAERVRRLNAQRGKPGVKSVRSEWFQELGRTYLKLGDETNALAALERGRALGTNPALLEDLASLYQAKGEPRKAAFALVEALVADPGRTQLTPRLVALYSSADPGGCAVSREGGAPGLNLQCPLVQNDICTASGKVIAVHEQWGHRWEAAAMRRTAVNELGCSAEMLSR